MLQKFGSLLFSEDRLPRILKITNILFLFSFVLVIYFPLLGQNTFIEEKQLKNSIMFAREIKRDFFREKVSEFLVMNMNNNMEDNNKIFNICSKIYDRDNDINDIYTIFSEVILSPRGEKLKFIQINLIYDMVNSSPELSNPQSKINSVFYALFSYLNNKSEIQWLSHDIQINYIRKELFYDNPKEAYERLTNGIYNKLVARGQQISAIFNFDLSSFDLVDFEGFYLGISGANSEQVDMDYFKMIVDNLYTNFNDYKLYTTNREVFDRRTKYKLYNIFDTLGCFSKDKKIYKDNMVYLIENIADNFFMVNNKINTNHLLISSNFNSILLYTISSSSTNIYKSKGQNVLKDNYYRFISDLELSIKGISKLEIDLFRGQYFYFLLSPSTFVGYAFLTVSILLTLYPFFQGIQMEYNINNKESKIRSSEICAYFMILSVICFYLIMNIHQIGTFISSITNIKIHQTFYIILIISSIVILSVFLLFSPNKEELNFAYLFLLRVTSPACWCIIFINIGIGIVAFIVLHLNEYINLKLKNKEKYIPIILMNFSIILSILYCKDLVNTMLDNYIKYFNNVYPIIASIIIYNIFRICIVLIFILKGYTNDENIEEVKLKIE